MKKLILSLFVMVCIAISAMAQDRTVSGTVRGKDDGLPIPGVNVKVKGTRLGATSGSDGTYRIGNVPQGSTILFSFIGYDAKEVELGSTKVIDVVLTLNSKQLGEVVINGYGSQTRSSVTGAVSQVKSGDLENKDFTSLDQSLQGKVVGLQSTGSSGQPGALQDVRIRGIGSITANASPLYVIDGIIINSGDLSRNTTTANALAGLNANDIESVNVLKDASASAIYGSRAANGVIVITTKQGKAGKTKVTLDAEFGSTKPGKLPDAGKSLTTDQWRTLTAEGILNNPSFATANGITSGNVNDYVNNTLGAGTGVNTNWLDVVQRNGRQEQYNLGISGGTDNTQFHISGGYFKQQGTIIASDFNRYSLNMDVKTKVNDQLSFSTTLIIGATGQHSPSGGSAFSNPISASQFLLPFLNPYNADGSYNIDPVTFPANNYNPLYNAANNTSALNQLKGLGTVSGEYKILDNLKFTSRIGVDYNNLEENNYWNPTYGDGQGYGGLSSRYYTRYFNWTWSNLADYHLDVNHDNTWVANVKAGYEAQKSQYYYSSVTATGFPANTAINVPSGGATPLEASGSNEDYTVASLLSLADFSYKGKYVISGSFRRDGSSRFGAANRYGDFWSVGGSWNAQQEDFIKQLTWINTLKVRASYGLTGNANIGNYNWRQLYSYGYNYNGLGGTAPTSVGNNNLTWETNKQLDLGLDLSVLKDRLSFTFDYYNRDATNLLLNQPTSLTTGFSSFTNNVGSMRNRGTEFSVSGTPVIAGDFKWQAGFNIAHNVNKVLSLVDGKDIISGAYINRVGLDVQTFYLRQWAGVNPANGSPLWYTDASRTTTTSNYNAAALVANKSASPKVFGSFTSSFSYKGFSLDGMLYYNFGNYVQDAWARYTQSDGANTSFNRVASQLDAWSKPGDITNTPIYIYNNTNNSSRASSRFLYKGDYVRLRELTAAYQFPKEILTKTKLSSLRVYVRGTNLLTWVRDKNLPFDPEQGVISQGNFNIAIPKVFTVGLNVGF
ncbi:TonB-dependent receptor [Pedobacter sp. L105]|uniref:SusC/RagA family TonB-linked outer membrane protein n=1 Tax=Pedobacter sp. L105 TaxID=1641871 RepID=UPI00131B0188|nr:TonB-dependent receptor [Pedobacter sp. L105]